MKKLLALLITFGLVVGISGVVGCDTKPTTPKATTPKPDDKDTDKGDLGDKIGDKGQEKEDKDKGPAITPPPPPPPPPPPEKEKDKGKEEEKPGDQG